MSERGSGADQPASTGTHPPTWSTTIWEARRRLIPSRILATRFASSVSRLSPDGPWGKGRGGERSGMVVVGVG